jgi:transposase
VPRFKPYSYEQTKLIPIDFNRQLQPGTFEFALNHIVDHMDLSIFHHRFRNDDTGAPAYDPAVLLKIVLFAYSRGITSSREIERACRENVVFMALSADTKPHFTTIAHFVSSMEAEITPLFLNVLAICAEEGLIGGRMFAVDGCKISSNCSKEWSGTRADFENKKLKLEKSIRLLLRKHKDTDDDEGPGPGMREQENKALERLRAKVNKFEKWLETNEDKKGSRGNIKQSNITDNESAKMPSVLAG